MASNYAISVESDARDNASYKLRVSRDGRTWNAVKDQAQLDAFHARATRLGATNGVAFSTKPSELEAYLSDVARHASSSEKEELVSSFLEADDDERGAERAFLEELAAVVPDAAARSKLADRFASYVSTRDASTDADVALQRARDQAAREARDALSRKTADILKAVRRTCDEHRRDRDRILAESAASVAAATREALSEGEKFDGLRALAMGAIQSAQGRADAQCARLTKENEALREELRDVVKRGVSDLSNSSTKDEPFAARKQQIVTSSSGSGSSGDSSGGSQRGSSNSEDGDEHIGRAEPTAHAIVDSIVKATVESHGRDSVLAKRLVAAEERERSLLHHILELRAALMEQGGAPPPLPPTLPPRAPRPSTREVDDDVEDARGDASS
mmetsp:Transcript_17520/g.46032  ORF Transcript_17520/g.46032 Transcript_17520/m.46032 type:complete len:389 (+) Transcript_17520:117-1283(+)